MATGSRLGVGGGRRTVLVGLLLLTVAVVVLGLGFRSLGVWVAAGVAPPVRADVIVALGGDDGQRVSKVAEIFRAGYASTILITGLEGSPERERAYYLNWRVKVLADAGVVADRIVVESAASNSFQEARATLALMRGRGWKKALVASEPAWWDAERWWASEKSAQFVLTELIKMGYYVWKY